MRYQRVHAAAVLLGAGLGGFLEGIVLRQILHWHQMLSSVLLPETVEAMRRNMAADGWFYLGAWLITLAGVFVLWSAIRGAGRLPSTRNVCAYMLIGWGVFNLVEGTIDHHLLELHHVHDLPAYNEVYDWVFLIVGGIGFVLAGLALRDGRHRVPAPVLERRSGGERRMA